MTAYLLYSLIGTLQNFFLLFLILYKKEFDLLKKDAKKKCDWLIGNDKIAGFEWRGGMERVTSGILIWSKPFICQDKLRRKVGLIPVTLNSSCVHNSPLFDLSIIFIYLSPAYNW